MRPVPIRWRFALWTMALVGVVLVVFSGGTFLNLYNEQIDAVDLEIETTANHLAEVSDFDATMQLVDEIVRDQPLLVFALIGGDGKIEKKSAKLPAQLANESMNLASLHSVRTTKEHGGSALFNREGGSSFWLIVWMKSTRRSVMSY